MELNIYLAASTLSDPGSDDQLRYRYEYAVELLKDGVEHTNTNDLNAAEAIFSEIHNSPAHDKLPFSTEADILFALCLVESAQRHKQPNKINDAKEILRKLSKSTPDGSVASADISLALGTLYFVSGDTRQAISFFKSGLAQRNTFKGVQKVFLMEHLGAATSRLAEQEGDAASLLEGIGYLEAADASASSLQPNEKGQFKYNLAIALFSYGKLKNDTSYYERSINFFVEAEKLLSENAQSVSWAHTQTNLGIAQLYLCEARNDKTICSASVESFKAALTVWDPNEPQHRWLATMFLLSDAYAELAKGDSTRTYLDARVETLKLAIPEIDHDQQSDKLFDAYKLITDTLVKLALQFHDINSQADGIRYLNLSERLLGERIISGLISRDDAYAEAVLVQRKREYLNSAFKNRRGHK